MANQMLSEAKASMSIFDSNDEGVYGVIAEFKHPGELLHAAEEVHKTGYTHFDTHSPFPIHGMDKAMGLGNSNVGWFTFIGDATGLALATWLQWWTGEIDYPLNISGKPLFAFEPSIPVMFELTVLFSAYAAVLGMLVLNGLPRPYNPLFYSKNFSRASDDAFFVHIAASDDMFDVEKTSAFLKSIGGTNVEVIHDHGNAEVTMGGDGQASGEPHVTPTSTAHA